LTWRFVSAECAFKDLLNVVQIPLIGHNQAAPRTPLESPGLARTMGVPAPAERV
jgi:hypothetical protein